MSKIFVNFRKFSSLKISDNTGEISKLRKVKSTNSYGTHYKY